MRSLEGTVAWITGAGTGSGRSAALALAGAGVQLVLTGRRREPLEETARLADGKGPEALIEPANVTDAAAVQAIADRIQERFGRLDILVNNAGINRRERHWRDL